MSTAREVVAKALFEHRKGGTSYEKKTWETLPAQTRGRILSDADICLLAVVEMLLPAQDVNVPPLDDEDVGWHKAVAGILGVLRGTIPVPMLNPVTGKLQPPPEGQALPWTGGQPGHVVGIDKAGPQLLSTCDHCDQPSIVVANGKRACVDHLDVMFDEVAGKAREAVGILQEHLRGHS